MARRIDPRLYVEARQERGETAYYPACKRAQALAAIAGTRTLSWETIRQIRALGFEIIEREPAPMFAAA